MDKKQGTEKTLRLMVFKCEDTYFNDGLNVEIKRNRFTDDEAVKDSYSIEKGRVFVGFVDIIFNEPVNINEMIIISQISMLKERKNKLNTDYQVAVDRIDNKIAELSAIEDKS